MNATNEVKGNAGQVPAAVQLHQGTAAKFVHLADHDGTIFQLISPLTTFPEHKLVTSFGAPLETRLGEIDKLAKDKDAVLVFHATGNSKPFFDKKEEIIAKFARAYLFLHISPRHFLLKNRVAELEAAARLAKNCGVQVLTYAPNLKDIFAVHGIDVIPIQVGVDFGNLTPLPSEQRKYITTICTSGESVYHYVKGIDTFVKIAKELGIEKDCLILGTDTQLYPDIRTMRVSQAESQELLRRSRVYVQLSRTEAYNLSAVCAKRMQVPVVVSDIEGHRDNVKYGFRVESEESAKATIQAILSGDAAFRTADVVERNYQDSCERETLKNFREQLALLATRGHND